MKKVILLFLVSLMFIGCKDTYDGRIYRMDSFDLEYVVDGIYKDTHTGVLYRRWLKGILPVMEADGTALTFEEWEKRIDNSGKYGNLVNLEVKKIDENMYEIVCTTK